MGVYEQKQGAAPQQDLLKYRPPTTTQTSADITVSGAVWDAAFDLYNDVTNLSDWMSRDARGEFDREFDFVAAAKASEVFLQMPEAFDDVRNEEDFRIIENRILKEQAQRRVIDAAGVPGVLAAMAAGLLSPTILLPAGQLRAGAGVARNAYQTAKWGFAGAAAQEAVLYGTQETYTKTEALVGTTAGTVLAGLLGSAYGALTPKQVAVSGALLASGEQRYINYNPAGADITATNMNRFDLDADAGDPKKAFGIGKLASKLGPTTNVIYNSMSPAARWMMKQMDSAGQRFEGNAEGIASAAGGDLITLTKQYEGRFAMGQQQSRRLFAQRTNRAMREGEWREEVGLALSQGGKHSDPDVERAANVWRETVFRPIYQAAVRAGVKGFDQIEEEDVLTYLPRLLRKQFAINDRNALEEILTLNAERMLEADLQKRLSRMEKQASRLEEEASDISLGVDEAKAIREELEFEMATLPSEFPEVENLAQQIRALRAEARVAREKDERAALRAEATRLEKENKDNLSSFKSAENRIKRRFRNLDKNWNALRTRQRKLLRRVEALEEQQLATLNRLVHSGAKLLARLDRLSPEAADEAMRKFETQFENAMGVFERGEARLAKLRGDKEIEHLVDDDLTPTEKISKHEAAQAARAEKVETILARMEEADASIAAKRQAIQEALQEAQRRALRVNEKRTLAKQRLRERADDLDPNQVEVRRKALTAKARDLRQEADAEVDFKPDARKIGSEVTNSLLGNHIRSPGVTLLTERGPMLARTLKIDPQEEWTLADGSVRKYGEFLQWDIERVARAYVRSAGPDIELTARFGSVNPIAKSGTEHDSAIGKRIAEDYARQRAQAKTENERQKIAANEKRTMQDLEAVVARIRHQRGIPEDPQGIGFRLGRMALAIGTLRLMGGVVIASLPDLARHTMKFGVGAGFRDGLMPLMTNFKEIRKFQKEELVWAGTATETILHGRAAGLFDVLQEVEQGTRVERGIQQLSNRMGLIALFDYWTNANKQFAGTLAHFAIMRNLDILMDPGKVSARKLKRATEDLAALNIDSTAARKIWHELTERPGGGTRLKNGVILPNTEAWVGDAAALDAQRIYRSAIARAVDDTIITPGTELPKWADGNMWGRLIFQFRSFTFSSTQKVMVAMAQDVRGGRVAPAALGSAYSVALGMMGYYTWAAVRGGDQWKEAEKAGYDKLVDEGIARSGLLGVISEAWNTAQQIPGLSDKVTFAGDSVTKSPFTSPSERLAGPTFDMVFNTLDRILVTASDGNLTKETVNKATQLVPFNNLFYLQAFFAHIVGKQPKDILSEQLGVD